MRILVIDDSQLPRLVALATFQEHGIEVLEAADGESGLQMVRDHSPDLIFLDLFMPGVSGRDVLTALQQDQPQIPVVVLTADADPETRDDCVALGARAVINKPRGCEEFLDAFRLVFPDSLKPS